MPSALLPRASLSPAATPLLDTRLISLHIIAILFAFGLLVLAFGCAVLYQTQERMLKRRRALSGLLGRLPPLARLEQTAFTLVVFAFPLLSVGLLAGAIGMATGGLRGVGATDPKVLASLATWLVYGTYLALHTLAHWRGPRANLLLLAGLPAILVTLFAPTAHRFG